VSPVKSVAEALARCAATNSWTVGMCGQFCAAMYGYGASGYNDAVLQWQSIPGRLKTPGSVNAPAGALVFWGGGSKGHGHVAIADGTGSVWSIDINGAGTVGRATTGTITARWGLPVLGWSYPYFQGQEWSPPMIYGLDVAAYQANAVPSRTPSDSKPVDFCFIKATQGTSYINPRMAAQAASARNQGMVVGFYHFLEKGNVNAQIDYFLTHAASVEGDLFAIDWETNPATSTYPSNAEKDAAIKRVQALRPTHKCLLYCNTSFWKGIDTTSFAGDGLWIATAGYAAGKPPVASAWAMHQYSTAGDYDHDVAAFENRAAMRAWAEEGSDVALSADDKAWIVSQLKSVVPAAVLTTDGLLESPADAADHDTNPWWTLETYVKDTGARTRQATGVLADILAQTRTNGSGISALAQSLAAAHTKLDAVAATIEALDLDQLPAEVAAKLNGLRFVLQEGN